MGASSTKSVQWSRTLDPHMSLTESSEHSAVCLQNEDPAWRCGTGSDLGGTGEQVRAASCIQLRCYRGVNRARGRSNPRTSLAELAFSQLFPCVPYISLLIVEILYDILH